MTNANLKSNLTPKEAGRLFKATNVFADTLEDILESTGQYSTEFINGLNLSIRQAKDGNLKKVSSLTKLII